MGGKLLKYLSPIDKGFPNWILSINYVCVRTLEINDLLQSQEISTYNIFGLSLQ